MGCTALATRATLLLYDCYKLWRRNFEASIKLLRASDHESANNCRAAIMLELGGYCFLQMSPPQFRKYAFHLVPSGILNQRTTCVIGVEMSSQRV